MMKVKETIKYMICKARPEFSCKDCENIVSTDIPELTPIEIKPSTYKPKRVNVFLPSINRSDVFGGISTAINFFKKLEDVLSDEFSFRVIITDAAKSDTVNDFDGYKTVGLEDDLEHKYQLVYANDRSGKYLPVGANDIFLATAWWTAYNAKMIIKKQNELYRSSHPLLYFIQDYEPGFYPWSSRYALADSTYKSDVEIIAIINSKELHEYMEFRGYDFYKAYFFLPQINKTLKSFLPKLENTKKVNRILVYGRPSVARNTFEIVVNSLKAFTKNKEALHWEFISVGERHRDLDLGNGCTLISKGKVALEEYANYLLSSKLGLSLMISPHPSYPPLEMAYFGIKTITNTYENKNLSYMHENITSMDNLNPDTIGQKLVELSNSPMATENLKYEPSYLGNDEQFDFIDSLVEIMHSTSYQSNRRSCILN